MCATCVPETLHCIRHPAPLLCWRCCAADAPTQHEHRKSPRPWPRRRTQTEVICVRGYAMTAGDIDQTTAAPFCGYNVGSTIFRAVPDREDAPRKFVFESPVVRLASDFQYGNAYSDGYDITDPNWQPDRCILLCPPTRGSSASYRDSPALREYRARMARRQNHPDCRYKHARSGCRRLSRPTVRAVLHDASTRSRPSCHRLLDDCHWSRPLGMA
jgi:hypothetical protein